MTRLHTIRFLLLSLPLYAALTLNAQSNLKLALLDSQRVFTKVPFASCHAGTLEGLSEGKVMAAWFGGPYESSPEVGIWTATLQDGHWSEPVEAANGIVSPGVRYACWNPVLFKTHNGRLILYYKVGPNPRAWWGMMKYSEDEGAHWSPAIRLPNDILGPIKNKPIQLADGSILAPSSTESKDDKVWHVHLEKYDSVGGHARKIDVDCGKFGVIQPTLLTHADGRIQLLCRSGNDVICESWSSDQGEHWTPMRATSLPNPDSGIDAVTTKIAQHLLVYNPTIRGKEWDDGRNLLSVAASPDGKAWLNVFVLENQKHGEFSYPAIIQTEDEKIHILYTYDRKGMKYVQLKVLR